MPSSSSSSSMAAAVISGSAVMLTLGATYCLGGLAPYLISHLRLNSSGSRDASTDAGLSTGAIVWVFVTAAFCQGLGMLAGGIAAAALPIDRRWLILAGCAVCSLGTLLTAFAVQVSFALVIVTSGVVFGLGQGFAYALILESVTSWSTGHKGFVTGVLVAAFALGAILFVPLQSAIINPGNRTPNWSVGRDRLFQQPEVLGRVPLSYMVMSAVYLSIQLASISFVRRRPPAETATEKAALQPNEANETQESSWTLPSSLKSLPFLVMGASIFLLTPATIVMPSLDKAYGETFISNDILLSVLAGVAAGFNALGRLVAGLLADRLHFRVCVLCQGLVLSVLHLLTPLSVGASPFVYFLLTCSINFAFAGTFVYFPCAVESLFGSALFPQVYGVVYMFKAVAGTLVGVMTTVGLQQMGWTAVILATGGAAAAGGLVILLFNTDPWRWSIELC